MERMTVEQALALLNTLTHECGGNRDIQALATLRAELDGLRADAERYRWLRDDPPTDLCVRSTSRHGNMVYVDGSVLDRAIDAAIDAARQEKGHE